MCNVEAPLWHLSTAQHPQHPPPHLLQTIVAHCRAQYPHEACGAWSQNTHGAWQHHPIPNIATAAERTRSFVLSPIAMLPLLEAQDAGQLTLCGLYHSHPDHPTAMSDDDRQGLHFANRPAYPGLLHLIVGLYSGGQVNTALYECPVLQRHSQRRANYTNTTRVEIS